MADLETQECAACDGWVPPLNDAQIVDLQRELSPEWVVAADASSLTRRFIFKGFAKAVFTANLAAFVSDRTGHHADISFGWGYCEVVFTSHDMGNRLSRNDFICAAKLDAALA